MTDSETELTDGERYWTPFAQASRITNELRDVMEMLKRNEVVNAYTAIKTTCHHAISLWSDLRPEDADDEH